MKKNSRAFVNQLLVWLLVTLCFGGSLGVATVWTRYKISDTANTNRKLSTEVAAVERLIAEATTQAETELRADLLRRLNGDMRLGLVPMSEVDIIHMTSDPLPGLRLRASRELPSERAAPINVKVANR